MSSPADQMQSMIRNLEEKTGKPLAEHRVRVSSAEEVDAELIGWLRAAYDSA